MNKFWTYSSIENQQSYLFDKNHILMILVSLVIIIFFSMYASRQKLKYQKIFTAIILTIIVVLEIIKIIFRYFYLKANNEELSFLNVVEFDLFTISLWISVPLILVAIFTKNKYKNNLILLNFVFFVTNLSAIITVIYPIGLNQNFQIYHIYNLIYFLIRSLVVMLSLFFIFSNWLQINKFLDLWKAFFSLLFLCLVCSLLGLLIGKEVNLFYINYCPLFENMGIHLGYPFNYLMIGVFFFVLQILLFLPFYVYSNFKYRKT